MKSALVHAAFSSGKAGYVHILQDSFAFLEIGDIASTQLS